MGLFVKMDPWAVERPKTPGRKRSPTFFLLDKAKSTGYFLKMEQKDQHEESGSMRQTTHIFETSAEGILFES